MEKNKDLDDKLSDIGPVSGMYENWFLDYASYVILERAVPAIEDGLKPVQRRIMHAMYEMDDGRYNKVANVIGQTMQYHPHGDASIGDAIVNLGQKDLLIDTQGNWGDMRTGDGAAAPRYIEARLSKFANDILFNPQTTNWQVSYDGRKREPVTLPVKFPLLLAQGVEGIAVGLATKILPHNFCELIEASIDLLNNQPITLYPDFPTGGMIDVSNYNDGQKGGKVRIRARIEDVDKKMLVIRDIPFSTTTTSLMESIVKANDTGKIKIKKVVDNTAKDVEIQVHLAPGVSPDITIDALYAFTDCEVSISPNACVIIEEKPHFVSVSQILRYNTEQTMELLRRELEIKRGELLEKILFSSLEKIFIENKIYRDIEDCETWDAVLKTIDTGLEPFKPQFYRTIIEEDLVKLTEIRIKRISKFDAFKANELMRGLQAELEETEKQLANLRTYTIRYYRDLLKKYGKGRDRKTEIRTFDVIAANVVAANNQKLYVNRTEGFIGYGLKKDEFVCDCSDLDDVIIFRRDGVFKVVKIGEKVFVGKDILYANVFRKNDERMVYNMVYLDGDSGYTMAKRFQVLAITRDREYDLTKGGKGSKCLHFSANPNGEAESVTVQLSQGSKAKIKSLDYDFAGLDIKGRQSQGNIVTKHPVRKVVFKAAGVSTLGGLNLWYDEVISRLNTDQRGRFLGNFSGADTLLYVTKNGQYELTSFELTNRYEPENLLLLEKYNPEKVLSVVYYEGETKNHFVKRFKIETSTVGKPFGFIGEHKDSKVLVASTEPQPQIQVAYRKDKKMPQEMALYDVDVLAEVKGWKAIGTRLSQYIVQQVTLVNAQESDEAKQLGLWQQS